MNWNHKRQREDGEVDNDGTPKGRHSLFHLQCFEKHMIYFRGKGISFTMF